MSNNDLCSLGRDLHRFWSARISKVEPTSNFKLAVYSDGFDTLPCTYLGTAKLALGSSELPDEDAYLEISIAVASS
jgi:hypothetical protein